MTSPDRKKAPVLNPVTLGNLPEPERYILDNGIHVHVINAGTEEITRIEFCFPAGAVVEEVPLTASTVSMMLFEGSAGQSAEEINQKLDFYGVHPAQFVEKDYAGLNMIFINRHIENVLPLCQEILLQPDFPEDELHNLMKKRQQAFLVNREKVSTLASDKINELLFGASHPYGKTAQKEDYGNMNTSLLRNFHNDFYVTSAMTIFVSGRTHPGTISMLNRYFGSIRPGDANKYKVTDLPPSTKPVKVHVVKKGTVQSAIRIGSRTIIKTHPDYYGLKVLDTILGGYFGSRLMKNIREQKGYTYGIHSSVISYKLSGYKAISAEVGAAHSRDAVKEIMNEIRLLQTEPVDADELNVVRNYMLGELVRMFDGPFAIGESFRSAWEFGLDNSYYRKFAEKINLITPDEIIRLAEAYYKTEDLFEVIAGPE
ncbi:MAG: pitrilysin family protein [Bacteroidales bacterium]